MPCDLLYFDYYFFFRDFTCDKIAIASNIQTKYSNDLHYLHLAVTCCKLLTEWKKKYKINFRHLNFSLPKWSQSSLHKSLDMSSTESRERESWKKEKQRERERKRKWYSYRLKYSSKSAISSRTSEFNYSQQL